MRNIGQDVGGWLKAHGSAGEGIIERTKMEVLLLVMENGPSLYPWVTPLEWSLTLSPVCLSM
jgi:hypothetical protein